MSPRHHKTKPVTEAELSELRELADLGFSHDELAALFDRPKSVIARIARAKGIKISSPKLRTYQVASRWRAILMETLQALEADRPAKAVNIIEGALRL